MCESSLLPKKVIPLRVDLKNVQGIMAKFINNSIPTRHIRAFIFISDFLSCLFDHFQSNQNFSAKLESAFLAKYWIVIFPS
jgi:hypothetical protein